MTQSCRLPLIQRPMISSVRPARSSPPPSGYTSELSRNVIPPVDARSMIANEVASSHWYPNVIVPRQSLETFKPVEPSRTCCKSSSSYANRITRYVEKIKILLALLANVKLHVPSRTREYLGF